MATVRTNVRLDMTIQDVWYGTVTRADATTIEITAGDAVARYTGSFSYDAYNVYGQLRGYAAYFDGALQGTVSGLNVDAYWFSEALGYGDATAIYQMMFRGADQFFGSNFGDRLLGFGGDDVMSGAGGNDVLQGGAGNDRLDGGTGSDRLEGGLGNDVYLLATSGDTVAEAAGAGTDMVQAGYSYTLGANVEYLVLTGTAALNGTGNALANRLTGNSAANVLSGGAGQDALLGGGGADRLIGGLGADRLTGSAGNDSFQFNSFSERGDLLTDFSNVAGNNDHFRIGAAGFGVGLVAGTTLAASHFQSRGDNFAQDSNDRFIFRTTDTTLWFDTDGKGGAAAVLVADLQVGATLTHADILLV